MSDQEQARLTILVVEDDWLVRRALVAFLQGANCAVVEAESGEAAVAVLRKRNSIDIVFTDLRLGGALSGWDVGEASRAQDARLPVIYTSGAVVSPERPVPGSLFVPKPYDPYRVLEACRSLCEAQRSTAGNDA